MTKTSMAIRALLALAAVVVTFFVVNRPGKVSIDAPIATGFPQQGFSHAAVEDLLLEYVTPEGQVDYIAGMATGSLHDDLDRANGYNVEFRDYDWNLNGTR